MKKFRAFLNDPRVKARIVTRLDGGAKYYPHLVDEVVDYAAVHPDITTCDPASIVRAVARWATWGLVLDVGAFLFPGKPAVPGDKPPLVAYQGYRGKIELMTKRFRVARRVDAKIWYAEEQFTVFEGTHPRIEHERIADPHKRGPMVGAYAVAELPFGTGIKIEVLHRSKIDQIRVDHSRDFATGDLDDLEWYPKRTAVHQLEAQIPMSASQRRLLLDDSDGAEPDAPDVATDLPAEVSAPAGASTSLPHHSIDPLAVMWEAQVA